MTPNAHKLPRIPSALLITVFTYFLIIFLLNVYLFMSLSSKVYVCFFFTHVFFFNSFSNGLKFLKSNLNTVYWLSIAHPAFQDIGIGMGCQKKYIGRPLFTTNLST